MTLAHMAFLCGIQMFLMSAKPFSKNLFFSNLFSCECEQDGKQTVNDFCVFFHCQRIEGRKSVANGGYQIIELSTFFCQASTQNRVNSDHALYIVESSDQFWVKPLEAVKRSSKCFSRLMFYLIFISCLTLFKKSFLNLEYAYARLVFMHLLNDIQVTRLLKEMI